MSKPSRFEMRIEDIVIPENRPARVEVIENNMSVFNVGGSVLRRKALEYPNRNQVGQNEDKEKEAFTIAQPDIDTIPDLHLAALEESTSSVLR